MSKSLRSVVGIVFTAGILVSGVLWAAAAQEDNTQVRRLLAQRLATVTKLHETSAELYVGGKVTLDDVLEAQASLLDASLAVARTSDERRRVRANHIKIAEELLKNVSEKAQGGVEPIVSELKAEAQLLQMRIDFERQKESEFSN